MQKIFEKNLLLFLGGRHQTVHLDFFCSNTPRRCLRSPHMNYPLLGLLFIYEDAQESLVGNIVGSSESSLVFEVLREDIDENLKSQPLGKSLTCQEMLDLIERGGRLLLLQRLDEAYVPYLSFDNTL